MTAEVCWMAGTAHPDKVLAQEHMPARASASSKLSAEMQLNISTESAYHRGRAERGGLPCHSGWQGGALELEQLDERDLATVWL